MRRPITILKLILPVLFAITLPVQAKDFEKERALFLLAEDALQNNRLDEYRELKASLGNYPLLPYLEYDELTKDLDKTGLNKIKAFLEKYNDTPAEIRLRWTTLFHLAKKKRWREFLDLYEENRNTKLQCHRITALLNQGKKEQAQKLTPPLWLSSKSTPDACDPAIAALKAAGKLTPKLIWDRMDLIRTKKSKKRVPLMKYMRKLLPAKEHGYHALWMHSLRNPDKVLNSSLLNKEHPSRGNLLVHALSRMAWRNRDAALRAWKKYNKRGWLDATHKKRIEMQLGKALSRRNHPRATAFLDNIEHCHQIYGLCELRVRHALKYRKWHKVISWINDLPKKKQKHEKWGYWKARALEQTGKKSEAKQLFAEVAKDRSYHGFLAADKVNAPYKFANKPLKFSKKELKAFSDKPGIQRAHELYLLDRQYQARREWRWITRKLDHPGLKVAAVVANQWGWYKRAIYTLLPTRYWDDLDIRFPLGFKKLVEAQARKYNINPAWIYAVIRQESTFDVNARSPVGAMGLMQLMPQTARGVARKLRIKRPRAKDVMMPENNIRLGSRYLKELYDQFNGWVMLATPSYNAGPHRTKKWLPNKTVPADLWIEDIPFNETRLYVQRVMSYLALYEHRLGEKVTRLRNRMPPIRSTVPKKKKR